MIDISTGESLGVNEEGEICIKTPAVMLGYRNAPEDTKACTDEEGFLHTGVIHKFSLLLSLYESDKQKSSFSFFKLSQN